METQSKEKAAEPQGAAQDAPVDEKAAKLQALLEGKDQKAEQNAGPMTTIISVLAIVGFVVWIIWFSLGGGEASKEPPKRMSDEDLKSAVAKAAESDPELEAMLVPKPKAPKDIASLKADVDLNKASAEELGKVPGLGEWEINAILKARPFKSKNELLERKIVGKSRFETASRYLVVSGE